MLSFMLGSSHQMPGPSSPVSSVDCDTSLAHSAVEDFLRYPCADRSDIYSIYTASVRCYELISEASCRLSLEQDLILKLKQVNAGLSQSLDELWQGELQGRRRRNVSSLYPELELSRKSL
jgi:hypothetical protein